MLQNKLKFFKVYTAVFFTAAIVLIIVAALSQSKLEPSPHAESVISADKQMEQLMQQQKDMQQQIQTLTEQLEQANAKIKTLTDKE